ncbi:hypothetical protein ALC62_15405 [Cyphomyrmex costatus]|uniref:Uncharacterized protein n=1 Tax=Cyphomyrmex costatus TaxID=456900 RepID=A0A151I796_9HYME|nr:hypothetical protein ALC62_15405 [Cyphomyrmex costatus]
MMFLLRTDVEEKNSEKREKLIFSTLKINSLEFFLRSQVDHVGGDRSICRQVCIFQRNSGTTERRALIASSRPLSRAVPITSFLSEFVLVSEVVAPQHYRLLNIEATRAMSLIKPGY